MFQQDTTLHPIARKDYRWGFVLVLFMRELLRKISQTLSQRPNSCENMARQKEI